MWIKAKQKAQKRKGLIDEYHKQRNETNKKTKNEPSGNHIKTHTKLIFCVTPMKFDKFTWKSNSLCLKEKKRNKTKMLTKCQNILLR